MWTISKTRNIQADIDEDKFTTRNEKPKGKSAQLKEEELTDNIHAKKCGFITPRPLRWALALEHILENGRLEYKWDYLCVDEDFVECQIKLFPMKAQNIKKILIEIKVNSGVVFISGTNHREWLSETFDPWAKLVETSEYTYQPSSVSQNENLLSKEDSDNELTQIWEEHSILKNSVTTLENSVCQLREDIQNLTSLITALKLSQETTIEALRKEYDHKVSGFSISGDEMIETKIKQCKLELKEDLEKQKSRNAKQEARLQSSIDQIKESVAAHKPVDLSLIEA